MLFILDNPIVRNNKLIGASLGGLPSMGEI